MCAIYHFLFKLNICSLINFIGFANYIICSDNVLLLPLRLLKKQKILRRGGKNTQKNCTKKSFTTKIIMMV